MALLAAEKVAFVFMVFVRLLHFCFSLFVKQCSCLIWLLEDGQPGFCCSGWLEEVVWRQPGQGAE